MHHGLPMFETVIEPVAGIEMLNVTPMDAEVIAAFVERTVIVAEYAPMGRFARLPGTMFSVAGVVLVFSETFNQLTPGML